MSGDVERLLLLLTDVLGDLKILDDNSELWTPESMRDELLEKEGGGLELASDLIHRIQSLDDKQTSTKLDSWDALMKGCSMHCPPWLAEKDLAKKPLLTKSEILCFLASTLQNKLLGQKKSSATVAIPQKSTTTTTSNTPTKSTPPTSSTSTSTSNTDPLLSLPPHLTQDQRTLIAVCYESMKADYDKRRVSMKQRLDILISNLEADSPDDCWTEWKPKWASLSWTTGNTTPLEGDELVQHFLTPHSKGLGKRTPTPKSGSSNPLETLTVVDRGGRTDEPESRISMPKWQ